MNDCAIIPLTHGMFAIVDIEDYDELNKYSWQARKSYSRYYAQRKSVHYGHEVWIRMHRQIMNTPWGYIVHHKNRRTLDNRKVNLENMTLRNHKLLHQTTFPGRLRIKRDPNFQEENAGTPTNS